jgi:hypothetical protein
MKRAGTASDKKGVAHLDRDRRSMASRSRRTRTLQNAQRGRLR